MTVQGTASAAATSVTIPAHAIGDLLLVFVRRASNSVATKPTATGTVPNWVVAQGAGANTLALTSAWFVATATNHTTGAWASGSHICVLVLRPDSGLVLSVGASATTNAATTQTIVYPALALSTTAGTSWGVRCGTRVTADSEVANPPTSWTNQSVQPAAAGALMAVHTRAALVANPIADTVTTAGTSAAYRAHTIEVTERPPSTGQPSAIIS